MFSISDRERIKKVKKEQIKRARCEVRDFIENMRFLFDIEEFEYVINKEENKEAYKLKKILGSALFNLSFYECDMIVGDNLRVQALDELKKAEKLMKKLSGDFYFKGYMYDDGQITLVSDSINELSNAIKALEAIPIKESEIEKEIFTKIRGEVFNFK